jgi:hypothetical protein
MIVHLSGKSTTCPAFHHNRRSACIKLQNAKAMKQKLALFTVAILMLSACATPKAYYETKEGKRKQKYYNDIQYGRNAHPKMKF